MKNCWCGKEIPENMASMMGMMSCKDFNPMNMCMEMIRAGSTNTKHSPKTNCKCFTFGKEGSGADCFQTFRNLSKQSSCYGLSKLKL